MAKAATKPQGPTLRPRQLSLFKFDYKAEDLADIQDTLEVHAGDCQTIEEKRRIAAIESALAEAQLFAENRKEFEKHKKPLDSWAAWVKGRLGRSVSYAQKQCAIWEVFGKYAGKEATIAGLPPNRLYKLTQKKNATKRAAIIKKAAKFHFESSEIDQLLGDGPKETDVSFKAKGKPTTHEELKAYVTEQIEKIERKLPEELVEDLPEVLHEIADEWVDADAPAAA